METLKRLRTRLWRTQPAVPIPRDLDLETFLLYYHRAFMPVRMATGDIPPQGYGRGMGNHPLSTVAPGTFHTGTLPEAETVFDPIAGHRHTGVDSRTVQHANLGGIGVNDHHAQLHGAADHTDRVRHLWVPVGAQGNSAAWFRSGNGYYGGYRLQDGILSRVCFTFKLPADFVSLVHLHPIIGSEGTGNMIWGVDTDYASNGEAHATHSNSSGVQTTAVTVDLITELPDMSAMINTAVIADYIGLHIDRFGGDVLDTVNADVILLGVLLEYNADM